MKKLLSIVIVIAMMLSLSTGLFVSASADPDQWLCDENSRSTGWWMNPASNADFYINATFDATSWFNGFYSFFFGVADVRIKLITAAGIEVENFIYSTAGDNFYTVNFEKAHAPGRYTLRFEATGNGSYFVLASSNSNGTTVTMKYNTPTNSSTLANPYIRLNGAEPGAVAEYMTCAFDNLFYDDTELVSSKAYLWVHDPANAEALDFMMGTVSTITFRGWAQVSTDVLGFGYQIDDKDMVAGEFIEDRAAELEGAGYPGAQGYRVPVPVDELKLGKHTIKIFVIADDGSSFPIVKTKDSVDYPVEIEFNVTENPDIPVVPAALHDKAFNTVWVDGALICDVGDALGFLDENPISGDIKTLGLRGWAWLDNAEIYRFGYKIDGGEPVLNAAYTQERGDVQSLFGVTAAEANGYNVNPIDVSGLKNGAHTATIVVKADDNSVLEIATVPFTIERPFVKPETQEEIVNALYELADNETLPEGPYTLTGVITAVNTAYSERYGNVTVTIVVGDLTDKPVMCYRIKGEGADIIDVGYTITVTGELVHFVNANNNAYEFKQDSTLDSFTAPVQLLNVSYDTLMYDANVLVNGSADKWIHNLEDPSVLDFQAGTVQNISFRGWVRISEDVSDIAGFGYTIDGGAVVTGDFIEDRAAELAGAGFTGAQGFTVVVPVADLAVGEHSIDVYLITADGTQVKVVKDRSTAEVEDIRQVGVTFNVTEEPQPPQPASLSAMSFNTVWVDDVQICDVGDALAFLAENPITGDVQSLGLRGWAWVANGSIGQFGYVLDGGDPVFNASYTQDRPDVQAAFGVTADIANGFHISAIDVSALASGNHIVKVVVKATDDTVIDVVEVPFSIQRPASLHSMSFNTVYADGALICDVGDALAYLEQNPLSGALKALVLRGWARIADGTIAMFGYKIDGGDPVFNAAYTQDRADVQAAFGVTADVANGFNVGPIDVSALEEGAHTVTILVKASDDTVLEVVTVPFSIREPTPEDNVAGKSWDWLAASGAFLTQAGHVEQYVVDNPLVVYKYATNTGANIIGGLGWGMLKDGATVSGFGYSIDDGAVVTEPVGGEALEHFFYPRDDELAAAGLPGAKGFWIVFSFDGLEGGEHTAKFYIIDENGVAAVIYEFTFTVVDVEWLCNDAGRTTGWWHNPLDGSATYETNVAFTSVNGFNGVYGFYFFNNPAAGAGTDYTTTTLTLLDSEGKVLETKAITGVGDGFYTTTFDKAYPAGTYTLRYTTGGSNGGWFVLASAPENGAAVTVTGGNTNENTMSNPYIALITAEAEPAGGLLGDVNGDGVVNNKDVVLLFKAVSENLDEGATYIEANADFNEDGAINNKDVVALFKAVSEA